MPNNTTYGDLETFLEGLLPEPRPSLWEYAGTATTTSLGHGAKFRSVQQAKAKLHAYLAWQDPPGNPYGTAVEAGAIGVTSPAADALVDWLNWCSVPRLSRHGRSRQMGVLSAMSMVQAACATGFERWAARYSEGVIQPRD